MWLWWFVSVIFLILCIGFAVRMLTTSRQIHRLILFGDNDRVRKSRVIFQGRLNDVVLQQNQELQGLQVKIRIMEENALNSNMQLLKLKERLDLLEIGSVQSVKLPVKQPFQDEENWEELYYEIAEKKEKLEDELDRVKQELSENDFPVNYQDKEKEVSVLRSELENLQNETSILKNVIDELQQKLVASEERERELSIQLDAEKNLRHELKHVKQQYTRVQSEADELRERINEFSKMVDFLLK